MNEDSNKLFSKRNIVSLAILAVLVLTIPLGVRLIENTAVYQSRAAEANIVFTGPNVVAASPIPVALDVNVDAVLTPPWPVGEGSEITPLPDDEEEIIGEGAAEWGDACNGVFNGNVSVANVTHESNTNPNIVDVNWNYENNQPRKSRSGKDLPPDFKYVGAFVTLTNGSKTLTAQTAWGCDATRGGVNGGFKDSCKPKARFVGLPKGKKTATLQIPDGFKMANDQKNTYEPNTEYCAGGSANKDKNYERSDVDAAKWTIEKI